MVKILAVNNYPTRERFERLERCVASNGAEVTSITWDEASPKKFDSYDGVVLSGSPDMMSEPRVQAKFSEEAEAIRETKSPVLGVCFGHQLMAHAFGSQVVKDREPVLGMVKTTVVAEDPLFQGLPRSMILLESRHEVVKSLPGGFRLLARSSTSRLAAMRHAELPLYGVQFHPERFTAEHPDGDRVVGNFIRLLR